MTRLSLSCNFARDGLQLGLALRRDGRRIPNTSVLSASVTFARASSNDPANDV